MTAEEKLKNLGKVYVVNGPTGAGKTSYVSFYKDPEDTVIDIDALRQALSLSPSLYEDRSYSSVYIATIIRDTILKEKEKIIYGGQNLWVIISEPDKYKINSFVNKLDAEYILLEPEIEICKKNILGDIRRINKQHFLSRIDKWYNYNPKKEDLVDFLSNEEVFNYCDEITKALNKLDVDYFISGSICAYKRMNIDLGRDIHDIDLYVWVKDIGKIKWYCDKNNIMFYDCGKDLDLIEKTGHMYFFYPFEGKDFHIGIIPFERGVNNEFIHWDYEIDIDKFFIRKDTFKGNSVISNIFSKNNENKFLPYEYAMVFKLLYGRPKDHNDYDKVCDTLDFNLMKAIKEDFKNAIFERTALN